MDRLHQLHTRPALMTALAFTCFGLAATPEQSRSQPAPAIPDAAIEVTFVNNHREGIEAMVWANRALMKLGIVNDGERRTFTLPPLVTGGARYYLLGDCKDGERIASDPMTASAERHAQFVVGRTAANSYVRYIRSSPATQQR